VTAALTEVLTAKPYLKRAAEAPAAPVVPPVTPTMPTNPARESTPAVTKESLKTMTTKQVAALPWEVVAAALKS
jgi:hypothetical protein